MFPKYKIRGLIFITLGILLIVSAAGVMASGALGDVSMLPVGGVGAIFCLSGLLYQSVMPRRLRRLRTPPR